MTDDLFRLTWLLDDSKSESAADGLKMLARKAAQYISDPKAGVFELDTQAIFVEPVLRGLGWDTLNPYQVDRAPRGAYVDVELWVPHRDASKRVAIIEVKKLSRAEEWQHVRVRGQSAYEQLKEYALSLLTVDSRSLAAPNSTPTLCGVATNGACWVVYDFDRSVERLLPSEHQAICEFDVGSPNAPALVEAIGREPLPQRLGLLET